MLHTPLAGQKQLSIPPQGLTSAHFYQIICLTHSYAPTHTPIDLNIFRNYGQNNILYLFTVAIALLVNIIIISTEMPKENINRAKEQSRQSISSSTMRQARRDLHTYLHQFQCVCELMVSAVLYVPSGAMLPAMRRRRLSMSNALMF